MLTRVTVIVLAGALGLGAAASAAAQSWNIFDGDGVIFAVDRASITGDGVVRYAYLQQAEPIEPGSWRYATITRRFDCATGTYEDLTAEITPVDAAEGTEVLAAMLDAGSEGFRDFACGSGKLTGWGFQSLDQVMAFQTAATAKMSGMHPYIYGEMGTEYALMGITQANWYFAETLAAGVDDDGYPVVAYYNVRPGFPEDGSVYDVLETSIDCEGRRTRTYQIGSAQIDDSYPVMGDPPDASWRGLDNPHDAMLVAWACDGAQPVHMVYSEDPGELYEATHALPASFWQGR